MSPINSLKNGGEQLVTLGIAELNHALAGSVAAGEMMILAARPSHGKSMLALQLVHHWTANGMPVLVISEEMSALALGKRALQFASNTPVEHWTASSKTMERDLAAYARGRKPAYIIESCRSVENVVEQIDRAVAEHGVQAVVVDYLQCLSSAKGKGRYEEVTNVSIALRQVTSKHQVVTVALCQLNRQLEGRQKFMPCMSDLRDSGQLEQDADVVVFQVWPHRLDNSKDPHEYMLFIAKNRNRAINTPAVKCSFDPARQTVTAETPHRRDYREMEPQRYNEFDAFGG